MGNQQLLILVIGIVVLGIAVAVGIAWFQDQAASSNRDQLAMDLAQFGVRAQAYYKRPSTLGGGQGSFGGLTMAKLTSQTPNMNGSYSMEGEPVVQNAQSITLTGTGTESLADGAPVKVVLKVYADSMMTIESEGH